MFNVKYLLLGLAILPTISMSADKHVHGEAELFIAIEGHQILLEFESPADNIIGFEHAPKTQPQHKQLESSLATLNDHRSIAAFSEANCQQTSAEVTSPFKDHHKTETNKDGHDSAHKEHTHDNHSHDKNHEKPGHTEFHTSYTLTCSESTPETHTIEINAFKHFAGIENITVNWVTPKGQGSTKATITNKELVLK